MATMDAEAQKRVDGVLEDEVQRGFRIKELPADERAVLRSYGLPDIPRVRFTRLNPAKRRKVNEVVVRQYHKDLQNKDLLSNEQIMKANVERGEWSPEHDERIKVLQHATNIAMSELYLEGLRDDDWNSQLQAAAALFHQLVEESELEDLTKKKLLAVFDRWAEYNSERMALYTERYAAEQELEAYSAARDLNFIMTNAPHEAAMEQVGIVDEMKDKIERFIRLGKERAELIELQLKHSRIFSESVESRRDSTEELARLYFTCEQVDEKGVPLGPVTPTFEELWDLPDEVVQWLTTENYFWSNGIPDVAREYLETFGFIKADRAATSTSGASEASGESPAPQSSKDDSLPSAETSVVSSA